jgi:hypothetical protein
MSTDSYEGYKEECEFQYSVKGDPLRRKENRDCSVVALAIAAKLPYHHAHGLWERAGREPRRGVMGCMIQKLFYNPAFRPADREFALVPDCCRIRFSTLTERLLLRPGRYYLRIRGHALPLVVLESGVERIVCLDGVVKPGTIVKATYLCIRTDGVDGSEKGAR